jgi:rod shape-determining protein MreC
VGGLVLAALVLITVSFRSSALDGVQGTGATVLKPFEIAADRVTRPFRDTVTWFHGLVDARNENKRLRAQIQDYRQQVIQDEGALQQSVYLQKELNYHGPPSVKDFAHVNAEVSVNPQSAIDQSIVILAGSNDGVHVNNVVVEPTGGLDDAGALIGIVTKVTPSQSRVTLLTSNASAVTATDLTDPKVVGSIRAGNSGVLILDQVPQEPTVRRGDTIITTGDLPGSGQFTSKFPKGIPIGTVSSRSNSDSSLFQDIQVKPLVDLTSIRSVVVLVPPKTTG